MQLKRIKQNVFGALKDTYASALGKTELLSAQVINYSKVDSSEFRLPSGCVSEKHFLHTYLLFIANKVNKVNPSFSYDLLELPMGKYIVCGEAMVKGAVYQESIAITDHLLFDSTSPYRPAALRQGLRGWTTTVRITKDRSKELEKYFSTLSEGK